MEVAHEGWLVHGVVYCSTEPIFTCHGDSGEGCLARRDFHLRRVGGQGEVVDDERSSHGVAEPESRISRGHGERVGCQRGTLASVDAEGAAA